MRIWIDWISKKICPAFYRLLQHTPSSAYSLDEARQNLANTIKEWIKEADPEGPYWFGKDLTMIDLILAPWNERWFIIDHYKHGGVGIPYVGNYGSQSIEQAFDGNVEEEKIWQRWMKWSKAISERESVRNTLSERDMMLKNYKRYADNETGSEVGQATREGKALP